MVVIPTVDRHGVGSYTPFLSLKTGTHHKWVRKPEIMKQYYDIIEIQWSVKTVNHVPYVSTYSAGICHILVPYDYVKSCYDRTRYIVALCVTTIAYLRTVPWCHIISCHCPNTSCSRTIASRCWYDIVVQYSYLSSLSLSIQRSCVVPRQHLLGRSGPFSSWPLGSYRFGVGRFRALLACCVDRSQFRNFSMYSSPIRPSHWAFFAVVPRLFHYFYLGRGLLLWFLHSADTWIYTLQLCLTRVEWESPYFTRRVTWEGDRWRVPVWSSEEASPWCEFGASRSTSYRLSVSAYLRVSQFRSLPVFFFYPPFLCRCRPSTAPFPWAHACLKVPVGSRKVDFFGA